MDAQQTSLYHAILIAGGIFLVIITYFIISLLGHQRRNQLLYKSKMQAEINTLEKERERVAADLHDELGPILASIKFKISSLDISSGDDHEMVNMIQENLDELIIRLRGISNDLIPNSLLRKGLITAMEESIDRLNKTANLQIRFTYEELPVFTQQVSVNLFRILQEIIHNTIKHARATRLSIHLKNENGILILQTSDNGIGFKIPADRADHKGGLGLRNLLSRAEIMGGQMYLDSEQGHGTNYIFEIPVN